MFATTIRRTIALFALGLALLAITGCSASPGQMARAAATAAPAIIDAADAYEAALPPTPTAGCTVCSGSSITTTGGISGTGSPSSTLNLPNSGSASGAPTPASQMPTTAPANSGAPTAMPSAPAAPTPAPAASAPAPVRFDPNNPDQNLYVGIKVFPNGSGQEIHMSPNPGDTSFTFGHAQYMEFIQLANAEWAKSLTWMSKYVSIQLLLAPGTSAEVDITRGWSGTGWLRDLVDWSDAFRAANDQVARARANGGDAAVPPTFVWDGEKLWVSIESDGVWVEAGPNTLELPEGITLTSSSSNTTAPVIDNGICLSTDSAFKAYANNSGENPIGDRTFGKQINVMLSDGNVVRLYVKPTWVLWTPEGEAGSARHVCADATTGLPVDVVLSDTTVVDGSTDLTKVSYTLPDGSTAEIDLAELGYHIAPFETNP